MKKILYFTAGVIPTATELAEIAVLNTLSSPSYDVKVRNALPSNSYGAGIEASDLVAGTVPVPHQGVTAYGSIATERPLTFDIWPKTGAVTATATLQLSAVKTTGTDLSNVATSIQSTLVGYVSSDPSKATVHPTSGLVTRVAAGSTTITATYTYVSGKTITATSVITAS